jgi:transposase
MLADLVRVGYLPRVWIPPHEIRELRRLVRYRQQLVNQRRAVKLRITALLREHRIANSDAPARRWSKRWLIWISESTKLTGISRWILDRHLRQLSTLGQQIDEAETRLYQETEDDVVVARLLEQTGIGLVTACAIRAEIGRFDRFRTGKQLSRFCGLSPRNASSGERQADSGLIKAGNDALRATIIEAAHRLIRWDERWSRLAQELRSRGKPTCVIVAAVANRWIRWLFHQMQPPSAA